MNQPGYDENSDNQRMIALLDRDGSKDIQNRHCRNRLVDRSLKW